MPSEEKRMWGIHTKDDNLFLHQDVIAIGWKDMGDLSLIQADRDAFKEKYTEVYPDAKKGSIANGAGMLYRFTHEVEIGDYVVFPSKIDRQINIGVVEGGYEYYPRHTVCGIYYRGVRVSFRQNKRNRRKYPHDKESFRRKLDRGCAEEVDDRYIPSGRLSRI